MKKTLLIAGFLFAGPMAVFGQSESYNPYLIQGVVTPAPLLPSEFNGTGTLTFDVGNTGSSDIALVVGQEMLLTITLSYGVPDNVDPVAAVSGPGAAWFSWEYFSATRTYRATQIATIPGGARETINIAYRVVENSFYGQSYKNGYNVNISPPGYTNPQPTDDDTVAAYTYVDAKDYGDAPASYGAAQHTIDLTKTDGFYNNYMYLGSAVDPDSAYQASSNAQGDDSNQTGGLNVNDEDGVTFPTMTPGSTVTIPVVLTIADGDLTGTPGKLNAWFDWNGDGDFLDAGERVKTNMSIDYEVLGGGATGTVNLSVTVPATATTGQTFARFRFGPSLLPLTDPLNPYKPVAYGEVEDYQITIQAPDQPATLGDRVWNDLDGDGVQESFEPGISGVRVYVDSNASGTYNAGEPTATTAADGSYHIADLVVGTYTARVDTATLPVGLTQTYDLNGALDHAAVVALSSGQTRTDVDFGYRSATVCVIRGQVRDDFDLDGTFSDPDLPVGGVLISLYSDPNGDGTNTDGVVLGTVRTTADGCYAFTNLLSGAYVVVEHDPHCAVSTADAFAHNDNMIAVIIVAADSVDNDFLDAVDPSGYFYDVADGRIVPGGQIVVSGEGADILMDGSNGQYMFVSTNQVETSFTIAVTPPTGYIIDTRRPAQSGSFDPTGGANPTVLGSYESLTNPGYLLNYSAASNTYYYTFTLAPGDPPVINNNFPLVRLSSLGNFVWEDLDGDGVQDAGEPGMTNITVRLLDAASNVVHTTVTDVNGDYSFTNLFPETYLVQVVPPAQYIFTLRDSPATNDLFDSDIDASGLTVPFVLDAGVTNLSWDAGLTLPARIYGHVYLDLDLNLVRNIRSDYPSANMTVTLWRAGLQVGSTLTASDGSGGYSFSNLVAGAYEIRFAGDTNMLEAVPVNPPASTDKERNRASVDGNGNIFIAATVAPGDGVLSQTEPNNAGFIVPPIPLSESVSIRAYSGSDGVHVEFATVSEAGYGFITVSVWQDGEWRELGSTLSIGFGSNTYSFKAPGLEAGKRYYFRVEDEVGYLYELYGVEVTSFALQLEMMERAGIRLRWQSIPGRSYQIYTAKSLAETWTYMDTVWADSESTWLDVTRDPQDRQRFFKIVMVRDEVIE